MAYKHASNRLRRDPWAVQYAVNPVSGRKRMQPSGGYATTADEIIEAAEYVRHVANPSDYIAFYFPDMNEDDYQISRLVTALAIPDDCALLAITHGEQSAILAKHGFDRHLILPLSDVDESFLADSLATALVDLYWHYPITHILLPDSVKSRDLAYRVAAQCNVMPTVSVQGFSAGGAIKRSSCGTKTVSCPLSPVMTISSDRIGATNQSQGEAMSIDWCSDMPPSAFIATREFSLSVEDLPLSEAALIFSAGDGVKDWAAFHQAARAANAATAGSRVVCDAGLLEKKRQVGTSGQSVTADVYVAFGISGAVQHLQGIAGCANVIAVNIDPESPIMKRADLGIVADANAVLKAMCQHSSQGEG